MDEMYRYLSLPAPVLHLLLTLRDRLLEQDGRRIVGIYDKFPSDSMSDGKLASPRRAIKNWLYTMQIHF